MTGASSGIGRALSKEFCKEDNNRVLGIGRNSESLNEIKKTYSDCFDYLVLDLSRVENIRLIVTEVAVRFDALDILVNNAGYGLYKGLLEVDINEMINMTPVNFIVPLALIKELQSFMRRGSTVVNIITASIHVLMTKLPLYGVWVSCWLISTLGFIVLGAPFIGAHVIGLHPFRVTPPTAHPHLARVHSCGETPTSWL
ncbi:MAG: SDR family NAD(P)-dependent oxidoreductase [Zestosphaera sp.]